MGQPFLALAYAQDANGKQGKALTVAEDGVKLEPQILSMNGATSGDRIEAAEKAVIAQLAVEKKYDPQADNVPIVFLCPFKRIADLKTSQK